MLYFLMLTPCQSTLCITFFAQNCYNLTLPCELGSTVIFCGNWEDRMWCIHTFTEVYASWLLLLPVVSGKYCTVRIAIAKCWKTKLTPKSSVWADYKNTFLLKVSILKQEKSNESKASSQFFNPFFHAQVLERAACHPASSWPWVPFLSDSFEPKKTTASIVQLIVK